MIDTMRHDHRAPDGRQASGEQASPEWGKLAEAIGKD